MELAICLFVIAYCSILFSSSSRSSLLLHLLLLPLLLADAVQFRHMLNLCVGFPRVLFVFFSIGVTFLHSKYDTAFCFRFLEFIDVNVPHRRWQTVFRVCCQFLFFNPNYNSVNSKQEEKKVSIEIFVKRKNARHIYSYT